MATKNCTMERQTLVHRASRPHASLRATFCQTLAMVSLHQVTIAPKLFASRANAKGQAGTLILVATCAAHHRQLYKQEMPSTNHATATFDAQKVRPAGVVDMIGTSAFQPQNM